MKVLAGVIAIFITIPIWYYLLYQLLVAANATDLMWFLYFAYIPFSLLAHVATSIAGNTEK